MIRLCFSPVKEDVLALVIVVHPLVLKFHLNHCQKQQNRKQNPAICGSRTHFIVTEAALVNAFNHHHCRAKRATIGGHDHNLRKQLEGVNQADNQDKEKRRSQQWQCNSCKLFDFAGTVDCRRIVVFLIDSLKARHQHRSAGRW